MNNATRWFFALALSSLLPGATQAQATLSLTRTRISFTDFIGGQGLSYEAPGTATRDYRFGADVVEADGSTTILDVIGRASTMASLAGNKSVSLRVVAFSIPSEGFSFRQTRAAKPSWASPTRSEKPEVRRSPCSPFSSR
jgi:hypothetical protein